MAELEERGTDNDVDTSNDPFSQEEAPGVQLIVQMRIYDALMALLTELAPDKAQALMELHEQGTLMGNSPAFTGTFVADTLKSTE